MSRRPAQREDVALDPPDEVADAVARAGEAAAAAAARAGIRITQRHDIATLEEAYRVIERVWRPDPANPPVTQALLRALTHAGNYFAAAYDGTTMVGVCLGFFAAPTGQAMHSHVAGATTAVQGRHVGFALKLHQRAWALRHGIRHIEWTFDPVVRRNAYFNATKLAAVPTRYFVDFYGDMNDGINAGQGSDRLLAEWDLTAPPVVAACAGRNHPPDIVDLRAQGAAVALDEAGGGPARTGEPLSGDRTWLVRVPADVEALRARDPGLGREWRHAVRDTLGALLRSGGVVRGVSRDGWYVVPGGGREDQRG